MITIPNEIYCAKCGKSIRAQILEERWYIGEQNKLIVGGSCDVCSVVTIIDYYSNYFGR